MSVHAAAIEGPANAADIVRDWRSRFSGGLLGLSSTPTEPQQRNSFVGKVNGHNGWFRPSGFSLDEVVLLTLAKSDKTLRVAFYDLAAGNFLSAIAVLNVPDRCKLGNHRDRAPFLRELIKSARSAQPRAAVGA
jgi:hypothetical protein